MEQMVGVQALSTDFLLAFQAEEDEVSLMERAKVVTNILDLHWRVLSWWLGLFELADRVLNLNVFR